MIVLNVSTLLVLNEYSVTVMIRLFLKDIVQTCSSFKYSSIIILFKHRYVTFL